MKIHSYNEWDKLKSVVVGVADNANWPVNDPVFNQESSKTSWTQSPVPSGPVPNWIVEETNEDLAGLVHILQNAGCEVYRPKDIDFVSHDGMYNYCPRDRLLIAGTSVVDPVMMYPCRDQEIDALDFITESVETIRMPRQVGMVMDAANVCRCNDSWVFLESASGNAQAHQWLQMQFPNILIEKVNFYSGVHIDSTIVPLREGLVMLNASRVLPDSVPKTFAGWDIIWVEDVVAQNFYKYPYASKWIAMNLLSLSPDTVILDSSQDRLRRQLEQRNITVIPHQLRHSRTLGGGFHCVTLDLWREHV